MKTLTKTNALLLQLIENLKKASWKNGAPIWRDIAKRLEKPARNWAEVNVSKLDKIANEGETLIIPGKLLGAGSMTKKVTVAAYAYSGSAAKKVAEAGGKPLTIRDLMDKNPKGAGVRIVG